MARRSEARPAYLRGEARVEAQEEGGGHEAGAAEAAVTVQQQPASHSYYLGGRCLHSTVHTVYSVLYTVWITLHSSHVSEQFTLKWTDHTQHFTVQLILYFAGYLLHPEDRLQENCQTGHTAVLQILLHCTTLHWDIIWKSRGGIMVNIVPREVPRPKPEGLFHIMSLL